MIVLTMVGAASPASSQEPIDYVLAFDDVSRHYVDVQMSFATGGQREIPLMMAVWTPGSYRVREYARHVEQLVASNGDGQPLPTTKTTKNRWLVEAGGADRVVVKYRVYCREMTVRTNWVERDFAMLNGAPTFLTRPDQMSHPHRVRLELPDRWEHSVTALPPVGDRAHQYQADNYDHLVDSPIVAGNPTLHPFEAGGREHLLVNLGGGTVWNGAAAARDVKKIVLEHQRMWGTIPYQRYFFLNMITESGGGLEHDNSTLIMTSRWKYRLPKDYLNWLGLVSHEFFHAWNVRRLRPKSLVTYDYERENYFPSLWVAEGVTSYYDTLAVARCGLCSQTEYLKRLSRSIQQFQKKPGRHVQSLRSSSHDAWIKYYLPDENSSNSRISYYTKGTVVSFLLDAKVRRLTGDRKNLDDVMRLLYERYHGDRGYTEEDFRAVASQVAGADLTEWFSKTIDSTEPLDYDEALEWFGLTFKETKPEDKSDGSAKSSKRKIWLGLQTKNQDGKLMVTQVLHYSPAAEAGVNVDDEILAINRYRVSPSNWESRLKQYKAGDQVTLLVSRRQQLIDLPIVLEDEPRNRWMLRVLPNATDQQRQRLQRWLSPSDGGR